MRLDGSVGGRDKYCTTLPSVSSPTLRRPHPAPAGMREESGVWGGRAARPRPAVPLPRDVLVRAFNPLGARMLESGQVLKNAASAVARLARFRP